MQYSFIRWLVYFALLCSSSFGQAQTTSLANPQSFCVGSLSECTPDKQNALVGLVKYDIRHLNQGKNEPITLVYNIPESLQGKKNLSLMVAPQFRNHCFQFDGHRSQTFCTERNLLTIPVPPESKYIYSQNTQSTDIRIVKPSLIVGATQDVHEAQIQFRDPVIGLVGWYLFLALAAAFQMLTRRNRWASLCLALLATALVIRTVTISNLAFAGISIFTPVIDRKLDYLSILIAAFFATGFYASFIGNKLLRTRIVFMSLLVVAGIFVVLVEEPQLVMVSMYIIQLVAISGLGVIVACIYFALKQLQPRERFVLILGNLVLVLGVLTDLVYTRMGWMYLMGGSGLSSYVFAFETLCQFILIALRNDSAHQDALAAQANAMQSQTLASQAQTESLLAQARSDQTLAQSKAQLAQNNALQIQAELARKDAELAQKEADYTKEQLQQADKMASLGQLVASVTHEINTPIGAISSSGQSITEALGDVIQQLPPLLQRLDASTSQLLVELLQQANNPKPPMSSREERAVVKKVAEQLDAVSIENVRQKASLLVQFNVQDDVPRYLPLLQHPESEQILDATRNLITAMGSARNVNVAVERVTKIVKALKSFSHFNIGTEKIDANLTEGMETVLTIYQGQTKVGVEVVRNYEEIPHLNCYPDELNQVWTNLIHNALHAMNHEGTLTIGIHKEGDNAVVSVGDSGCGIPEEIRGKIFDVFFTTKPAGVGSGLGLDIVKKIIDKHQGRIDLQSKVGVGTTFSVYLPYGTMQV